MTPLLENLKNYLAENNIQSYNNIRDSNILDDITQIVRKRNLKLFTPHVLIKLLLTEEEIYCNCGESLRSFDHNTRVFRTTCIKCAKRVSRDQAKFVRSLDNIYEGDYLTKDEVVGTIKSIGISSFFGSGKQRTLIKKYPKVYFSILKYTKILDDLRGKSIRARCLFLLDEDSIYCKCGSLVTCFDNQKLEFHKCCKKCTPRRNSLEWYMLFHPDNYKERYDADRQSRKRAARGIHTLEWCIKKYGDSEGLAVFNTHVERMLSNTSTNAISNISLTLFNNILLYGYSDALFGSHPKEKMFRLCSEYSALLNQELIFVDFFHNNNVIEFQGDYWHAHTKEKDQIRRAYLESIGMRVLFIYENEYKEDNIRELDKCLRFLSGESIQNKYKILTASGYSSFDNIIQKPKTKTLKFTLENDNQIEVSRDHTFVVGRNEIIAVTLVIGNMLQTKEGKLKIIRIEEDENIIYDVLHTEDHTYYANDILNHNCEFFGSSYTLISTEKLKSMEAKEIEEKRDNKLKIYHYPVPGNKYVMSVDPAKDGSDAFALHVIDVTTFEFKQVASANLQIDYLLMPEFLFEWCEYYNNPYLIIENNEGAGQSIADQMYQTYDYPNLHFDKDQGAKRKKKYPGFRTTSKSRKQILQTMKLFIENGKLEINDAVTIAEFVQFIIIDGKYQADDGAHDDSIMSLAIAFCVFANNKNFEDMELVIKNLYLGSDELSKEERITFADSLTLGNFDDGTIEGDFTEVSDPNDTFGF